jgi:hypothetical protein
VNKKRTYSNQCPECGGCMEVFYTIGRCMNEDCGLVFEVERVKQ